MPVTVYPDGIMLLESSSSFGSLIEIIDQANLPAPPACDLMELEEAAIEYLDALKDDDDDDDTTPPPRHHHIVFDEPPASPLPEPIRASTPISSKVPISSKAPIKNMARRTGGRPKAHRISTATQVNTYNLDLEVRMEESRERGVLFGRITKLENKIKKLKEELCVVRSATNGRLMRLEQFYFAFTD